MAGKARHWTESLVSVLESWGINLSPAKEQAQKEQVRVFWPEGRMAEDHKVLIGTLSNEAGEFVFRYAEDYAEDEDAPALPSFPDKKREYRSRHLWAFFEVRIPPTDRQDIQSLIREKNLEAGNKLKLLGELAKGSITTPYELELVESAA